MSIASQDLRYFSTNTTSTIKMRLSASILLHSVACFYLYLHMGSFLMSPTGGQVVIADAYEHNAFNNKQVLHDQGTNYMGQNFTITNRPLERPSLTLVQTLHQTTLNDSSSAKPEAPEAWLMMEGDDLQTNEARQFASISESEVGPKNITIKRSGKRKGSGKNSKSSSSSSGNSNKTQYDDEQQSDSSESNEIFDDVEDGLGSAGSMKEPECASHGRYYCTYKEDYPLKLVTEITKYYKWPLEKLFRDLHAQIMPKLSHDSTGNLVCDSITRVVRPGWARSTNDRWLVVINTENYHQYVTEVVCQYGTNSRCNFIPPCYYSSCQQRYNTQKLLVIDPLNPYRGPFLSEFLFPSCCVCYVPTASESFKDNYRSSPATIYQRTMQQEASNNLNPPKFKPVQTVEEVRASSFYDSQQPSASTQSKSSSSRSDKNSPSLQIPEPGEIRRAGDLYKSSRKEPSLQHKLDSHDLIDFPRLGLSEPLNSPGQRKSEVRAG